MLPSLPHAEAAKVASQKMLEGIWGTACVNSASHERLRFRLNQMSLLVLGNRLVDNSAAVDALPCVKHKEEIGEPLHRHHSFASPTFHGVYSQLMTVAIPFVQANPKPKFCFMEYQMLSKMREKCDAP
jgi:hypothetical protein